MRKLLAYSKLEFPSWNDHILSLKKKKKKGGKKKKKNLLVSSHYNNFCCSCVGKMMKEFVSTLCPYAKRVWKRDQFVTLYHT